MPFLDLKEAIEEEFSQTSGLAFNELRVIDKNSDAEYRRWYYKHVVYRNNREKELARHKAWAAENPDKVRQFYRDWYKRNADKKKAATAARKKKLRETPEGRQKLKEHHSGAQRRYYEKLRSDPELLKKSLESGRIRAKAYRERLKAKKMEQWQRDLQLYLNLKGQRSEAASDIQKVQNT
jgi:hypothetical protein